MTAQAVREIWQMPRGARLGSDIEQAPFGRFKAGVGIISISLEIQIAELDVSRFFVFGPSAYENYPRVFTVDLDAAAAPGDRFLPAEILADATALADRLQGRVGDHIGSGVPDVAREDGWRRSAEPHEDPVFYFFGSGSGRFDDLRNEAYASPQFSAGGWRDADRWVRVPFAEVVEYLPGVHGNDMVIGTSGADMLDGLGDGVAIIVFAGADVIDGNAWTPKTLLSGASDDLNGVADSQAGAAPTTSRFSFGPTTVVMIDDGGSPGSSASSSYLGAPAEILVQFAAGIGASARSEALAAIGGRAAEHIRSDLPGDAGSSLLRVELASGTTAEQGIDILSRCPGVEFVEKNWIVSVDAIADDPGYTGGMLWGMYGDNTSPQSIYGSQAGEAWNAGAVGSTKIVVGVIDSGIAYTHIDLYLNVWLNQGEIPSSSRVSLVDIDGDGLITFRDLNHSSNAAFVNDINGNGRIDAGDLLNDTRWENGLDEDRNGFRDDLIGWDFVNNDNDPWDDNNHGTHVSGTIGAKGGNGTGVAGVAWDVQMVGLKFLAADGSGSISNAVKALDYYTDVSKVAGFADFVATNNSWGGGGYSSAMQGAIDRTAQAGNLFVAAAGNAAVNTDTKANYPSAYSTVNAAGFEAVISVAAVTSSGALASFSNYGANTVDLGAPGASVYSTLANGSYGTMSGTSMAAPHVTGAIALYAAQNATASATDIRDALLGSVSATASLEGRTVTGGRLDAEAMVRYGLSAPPPADDPVLTAIYGTTGSDTLVGTSGNDTISGVPESGTHTGRGTVDVITGGAGLDIFILGDARGLFYNDGNSKTAGTGDYARIMDFRNGDKIQLSDDVATYFLNSASVGGFRGLGIYADIDRNGRFGNADELVGHVVGVSSLVPSDFVFADARAPKLQAGGVRFDGTGTQVTLAFDEALAAGSIQASAFAVTSGGQTIAVSGVTLSGSTATVSLGSTVAAGADASIAYTDPAGDQASGVLQDLAGNDVASFSVTATRAAASSSLSGMAYHWKSHTLLSGVTVSVTGDGKAPGANALVEIRSLALDANGDARFDVYANAGTGIENFGLDLRVGGTATVIWAETSFANWTVVPTTGPGQLTVAGFGASTLSGKIKLGSALVDLAAGADQVRIDVLSGEVGDALVPAFSQTLTAKTTATSSGTYALSNIADDVVTMSLARGTADLGSAINAQDALAALKIAVGRNPNVDPDGTGPLQPPPVSPYQFIAADVNGDGRVTSQDALAILKMAVRRVDAPSQDWIFVREDADFWNETTGAVSMDRNAVIYGKGPFAVSAGTAQDMNFVGILKGDVNGSWVPAAGAQTLGAEHFASLSQSLAVPVDIWG